MFEDIRIPWPGWKIVREIGRGSYGTVYEIERRNRKGTEKAALKVIAIPKDENEYDEMLIKAGYDEQAVDNIIRDKLLTVENEYAVMREMRGNSNIVSCDDFAYSENGDGSGYTVFIRMELMKSLQSIIKEKRRAHERFTEGEVIKLGKDICHALSVCETRNITHRDIKPENILVSRTGDYNLADFGIARTMDHTTTATMAGTRLYMAPEILKLERYGTTVDIYSLGLVMYWLLNGYRMPFEPQDTIPTGDDTAAALMKRLSGEKLPAPCNASRELSDVILKACAYKSYNRYRSASEMLKALEGVETKQDQEIRKLILQQKRQQQREQQQKEKQRHKNQKSPAEKSGLSKKKRWVILLCFCAIFLGGVLIYENGGLNLFHSDKLKARMKIKKVEAVSMNYGNTAIIDQDGCLWMWGDNRGGQIGDGTTNDRTTPVKIMDDVETVSVGYQLCAAVKSDGSLWMWGENRIFNFEDGIKENPHKPIKIMDDVKTVSIGFSDSAFIKTDGSLWTWEYYVDENNLMISYYKPVKIMDGVKAVALGEDIGAVIKTDGSLWIWGDNRYGQIGDGTKENRDEPVRIMDNVKTVALGHHNSAAIREDGSLWIWGDNLSGQIGDGTEGIEEYRLTPVRIMEDVQTVSLGGMHSAAIKIDGSLWLWGNNLYGELGDGTKNDHSEPFSLMTDVTSVTLGKFSSAAIKTDGSLWMWGDNEYGQLGEGEEEMDLFQAFPK